MDKKIPDTELFTKLIRKYGTPLQIYDGTAMIDNYTNFIYTFKKYFPTFEHHFAVKALPNPHILQILVDQGCGLDCSSMSELLLADMMQNLQPNKVIFTSNFTATNELKYAFDKGYTINLDCDSLLDVLIGNNILPKKLYLRFNPSIVTLAVGIPPTAASIE